MGPVVVDGAESQDVSAGLSFEVASGRGARNGGMDLILRFLFKHPSGLPFKNRFRFPGGFGLLKRRISGKNGKASPGMEGWTPNTQGNLAGGHDKRRGPRGLVVSPNIRVVIRAPKLMGTLHHPWGSWLPHGQVLYDYMGMGQNQATRGPHVLVHVAIYQGSILGTYF